MAPHLSQCSQHLTDLEDLVHLTVAWEQRSEGVQLCHDAADCPDIYRRVVRLGLEQNLWGSVPDIRAQGNIGEYWYGVI